MDKEKLKKDIADLEEKVITKIDYHFNWYIMIDYSEIPDFHYLYLIDDYDWYLYWIDVERDILSLLDYLIPTDDGLIDETQNVLSMKRIVDKKLLELSDNDHNQIYHDLEVMEDPNKKYSEVTNYLRFNIYQKDLDEVTSIFFSCLRENALISNNLTKAFKRNFTSTDEPSEKIIWEKNLNQLAGMLKHLVQEALLFGVINDIPHWIINYFTFRKKVRMDYKTIRKTVDKVHFNKQNPETNFAFIMELYRRLDPFRAKVGNSS
jgi:hypothetical protein